jgi:hypothetical protein
MTPISSKRARYVRGGHRSAPDAARRTSRSEILVLHPGDAETSWRSGSAAAGRSSEPLMAGTGPAPRPADRAPGPPTAPGNTAMVGRNAAARVHNQRVSAAACANRLRGGLQVTVPRVVTHSQ